LSSNAGALGGSALTLECTNAQFVIPAVTPEECQQRITSHPNAPVGSLCTYTPPDPAAFATAVARIGAMAPGVDVNSVNCTASPGTELPLGTDQVTVTCTYNDNGVTLTQSAGCIAQIVEPSPLQVECPDLTVNACNPDPVFPQACSLCYTVVTNCGIDSNTGNEYWCQSRLFGRSGVPLTDNAASCNGSLISTGGGAPELTYQPGPKTLWPPDHRYVAYGIEDCLGPTAIDQCTGASFDVLSNAQFVRVESDEPEDGRLDGQSIGDGRTCNDAVIVSPTQLLLRAERASHLDGRVYRIAVEVTDPGSGQVATATCFAAVPIDLTTPAVEERPCEYCVGEYCTCATHAPACNY
jgi:hypothetical protein